MLRTLFATTAVSVVMATGLIAQTADTQTETDDTELLLEDDTTTGTDEPALADDPEWEADDQGIADDPGAATDDPAMADDPAMGEDDPAMADDPAMDTEEPAMADDPAMETDEPAMADDPGADAPSLAMPGEQTVDLGQVAGDELVGSEVRGFDDDQIATVDEVVENGMGEVQSILVRFGGFLGFGATTVELQSDEFEVVRGEDSEELIVRTALSQDELENRPEAEN